MVRSALVCVGLVACGGGSSPPGHPDATAGQSDAPPPRVDGAPGDVPALYFGANGPNEHDYAEQLELPGGFGAGELTLELVVLLDDSFPVGPIVNGSPDQLVLWSSTDLEPYSSGEWWFEGNFLLDGHNNLAFSDGTFTLQFYGAGRVRWLFGDGAVDRPGGVWAVQAPSGTGPQLLDGAPHQIACVRRFTGASGAVLELWIDGVRVGTESTPARTNMRAYWDDWTGYPDDQRGWYWGAEKQAAIGDLAQYEDYKGAIADVRAWSVARSEAELAGGPAASGWAARWAFGEGAGDRACADGGGACWSLERARADAWRNIPAP
jgi:hypothetical protein